MVYVIIVITLCTSSFYQTLLLSNCKIFGFELFSMNMSKYGIMRFTKINFVFTTLLFDIPYLITQILFAIWMKKHEAMVIFSFILTFISILVNIISSLYTFTSYDKYNTTYVDIQITPTDQHDIKQIIKA
eukprot:123717_1